ncbi:hypothetical protein BCR33DRAFT_11950 [Rhizoclosmatium globosum]|uniref:Uncharacterized protein n=1 Tax=Rhizoclosmatium globosum TaxID=329046 RepID=A0A1Y2CP67_9FUNG|nr:hypothetical protein BCR33DRAFT_11950 [Rhizoclosmatium globosum]|eukprot:ORY48839.1 hypothetical protein BCR33DRAFT_11950 [Rhizoclosmatium globosum]
MNPQTVLTSVSEKLSTLYDSVKSAVVHQEQGSELIRDPHHSQGTGFSSDVRKQLHLQGLIPPAVETLDTQVARVIARINALSSNPLEQYTYLDRIVVKTRTCFIRLSWDI